MDEFEIYLLSNGSMQSFPNNTLSHFTNQLSERIYLEGEWAVAITEISYPTNIRNVSENEQVGYMSLIDGEVIQHHFEFYDLKSGIYCSVEELLDEIKIATSGSFEYSIDEQKKTLNLQMEKDSAFTFQSQEIPNILGLGMDDSTYGNGFWWFEQAKNKDGLIGKHSIDIMAGKHLMFIYLNIIDYQNVADTKAPLLRAITTKFRMKNGCLNNTQSIQHEKFENLQFKKLLTNTLSTINVEIRHETGQFVPFAGTGIVAITLKFKKLR